MVLVIIAEAGKTIGYTVVAKAEGQEIKRLVSGFSNGYRLDDRAYQRSKKEAEGLWKRRYPGCKLVYLECPRGIHPTAFANMQVDACLAQAQNQKTIWVSPTQLAVVRETGKR